MIKEIMTSEGKFFKELNGVKAVPTDPNGYLAYQTDLTIGAPNCAIYNNPAYLYGRVTLHGTKGYMAKVANDWCFIAESAVKIVGGVKSASIKLLHRFSVRKAVY